MFEILKKILIDLIENASFYIDLIISHLQISLMAASIAIVIGMLLGFLIVLKRKYAFLVINLVNVIYTIPSIAFLGLLIVVFGIGNLTAIIALTIYALLPIVKNTYLAIINVDAKIIEVAKALGSTEKEIFFKVKLPLAFPLIFGAISNMLIMTVALASIASFIGAKGLGVAIYRGITTNNQILIFNGSLLIALIAIVLEISLNFLKNQSSKTKIIALITVIGLSSSIFYFNQTQENVIKIASKPTTESFILAEMIALTIENNTNLQTSITHGVAGGSANIHPALLKKDFDIYPEYTGTAWNIILKKDSFYHEELFKLLADEYYQKYQLRWLSGFGFNNTYSLGIRKELADKHHIKTFSDLKRYAHNFTFGAEYDFFQREDGFNNLTKTYDLKFKQVLDMDNGLKYQALIEDHLDVMTVFTTDGQLNNPKISVLQDDLKFYPSYQAFILIRDDIIKNNHQLADVLKKLENILDEKTMSLLNYQVEILKHQPKTVAETFLKEKGIIK